MTKFFTLNLSSLKSACFGVSAAACIALASHSAMAQDRISVAEVNGSVIYLDEVMQLAEQVPDEYRRQPLGNYFDQLVDELIDTRLAAKAGADAQLDSDPLIADAMAMAMRKVLAEAYLAQELRNAVTEDEVRAAYDRFVADADSREEVRAAHILVPDAVKAEALIAELDAGADFAELAREHSTGPSGPNGGDLGYFPRGAMVPAFETAAFSMEVGSYSAFPVQTQFGFHILNVMDKRTGEAPAFDVMREQLAQTLTRQALVRQLELLRVGAEISRRSFDDVRNDASKAQNSAQ